VRLATRIAHGAIGRERLLASPLCFPTPGGPLVAIRGLHPGAPTSAVTALLARHAAHASPAGRVLAAELDPRVARLAALLGAASERSLDATAAALKTGTAPSGSGVAERDGLRVLASSRPAPAVAGDAAVLALLANARAAHGLVVLDAGGPADRPLPPAGLDVTVWVSEAARLRPSAISASGLGGAAGSRWVLALVTSDPGPLARPPLGWVAHELAAVVWIAADALDGRGGGTAALALARAVRG
jgi:hypothetical protein